MSLGIYDCLIPAEPIVRMGTPRLVQFDKTPPAIRENPDTKAEREDRLRMRDFRAHRVRKALAGGHWATFTAIMRRTGMAHAPLMAVLRVMVDAGKVEVTGGFLDKKWRLRAVDAAN